MTQTQYLTSESLHLAYAHQLDTLPYRQHIQVKLSLKQNIFTKVIQGSNNKRLNLRISVHFIKQWLKIIVYAKIGFS